MSIYKVEEVPTDTTVTWGIVAPSGVSVNWITSDGDTGIEVGDGAEHPKSVTTTSTSFTVTASFTNNTFVTKNATITPIATENIMTFGITPGTILSEKWYTS